MAFKMRGFPMQATSAFKAADGRQKKLKKGELLKTENPDTEVTGGSLSEEITDLEDRIEFIKEDINNQEGGATNAQKKDLAALKKRLAKLKDKMETGPGSYGNEEWDKE
tara:strand:+ start:214 stop:540 length:327 start_codon:yes stop_codon:yes gene_type:complete